MFFNVPARKKFLKTAVTEASHISELIEKLALSHPYISFRFINNGQTKLFTSGNGVLKDIIYQIYGRDITGSLLNLDFENESISVRGLIGKPEVSRPNRNFENYFVNGRYIKSSVISKAIEDAYEERLMQHQFPFAVLIIEVNPGVMDVNVHPTKMDVRFSKPYEIYDNVFKAVQSALKESVLVPQASFEKNDTPVAKPELKVKNDVRPAEPFEINRLKPMPTSTSSNEIPSIPDADTVDTEQLDFIHSAHISSGPEYKIVGQVFSTYWIIEYQSKMYIMDQHAAHEKIYFERLMKQYRNDRITSQQVNPPVIITLSETEAAVLAENIDDFITAGFEIESFGGNEYALRAIPDKLPSLDKAEFLKEMISDYSTEGRHKDVDYVLENHAERMEEYKKLVDELKSIVE